MQFTIVSCDTGTKNEYMEIHGQTMGTYYSIKAKTSHQHLQNEIDSILEEFDQIYSTYNPESSISGLNHASAGDFCLEDVSNGFQYTLDVALAVHKITAGYFDPTVMPLVNYWGFGTEKFKRSDFSQVEIDSLLTHIGFDKINWRSNGDTLCINKGSMVAQIDLSAIAKGYGVDIIAQHLSSHQISDYLVEIGGELRAMGHNSRDDWWTVGIERPISTSELDKRQNQAIIEIRDRSIASSGNYRNFYEMDDQLIGHTINPSTGFPEKNDLLSVSVMADDCIYADALATGFMALGYGRSKAVAATLNDAEVFFIYLDTINNEIKTDHTPGFSEYILGSE